VLKSSVWAALLLGSAAACAHSVGFQSVTIQDPGNPPLVTAIYYPTGDAAAPLQVGLDHADLAVGGAVDGALLKLIVFSHGQGGSGTNHMDTAIALAQAGFVVAAPTHTGDNLHDQSRVMRIWDRSRQLRAVTDWVLTAWPAHAHLDQAHIGVFGFSAGGFTALVEAGGEPDLSLIPAHCANYPAEYTCGLIRQAEPGKAALPTPPAGAFVHDRRIAAAVVAAPALGFTFTRDALKRVTVPVQVWRAGADDILPQPFYAQAVADALPSPPDYHVVPDALHLDFLSPCDAVKAQIVPVICHSLPGFDRAAFHRSFDEAVVRFFLRTLGE
jgi:predicted dienelactone hydrolase